MNVGKLTLIGGLVALLAGAGCADSPQHQNRISENATREERYFGDWSVWDRRMSMPYGCALGRGEVLGAGLAIAQTDNDAIAYYWISCKHEDGSISISRKAATAESSGYWNTVALENPYTFENDE